MAWSLKNFFFLSGPMGQLTDLSNSEARNSSGFTMQNPETSTEGQGCQLLGGTSEQPRERPVWDASQGRCSGSSLSIALPMSEAARALALLGT